jgi:hypothetical protein
MSKMGSHDPFGHLKHKLWSKERLRVKLAIWLPITKSQESFKCRWRVTYLWKYFDDGYNFALDLISIGGLHRKLCAPKVTRVPTLGISRLPLESPGTKCHLDAGHLARHKTYYKGEVGGFPQVYVVVSFVNPSCPWFVLTPKVLQLCANQLVFGFVQVCVSSWCLLFFLVSSRNSITPFYPQNVASQGMCLDSLLFQCFQFRLIFESIKNFENTSSTMGTPQGDIRFSPLHGFTFYN